MSNGTIALSKHRLKMETMELPDDPATPPLGTSSNTKTRIHTETRAQIHGGLIPVTVTKKEVDSEVHQLENG